MRRATPKGEKVYIGLQSKKFKLMVSFIYSKTPYLRAHVVTKLLQKQRQGAKAKAADIFRRFRNLPSTVCLLWFPFCCCDKPLWPKTTYEREGFTGFKISGQREVRTWTGSNTLDNKHGVGLLSGSHWVHFLLHHQSITYPVICPSLPPHPAIAGVIDTNHHP